MRARGPVHSGGQWLVRLALLMAVARVSAMVEFSVSGGTLTAVSGELTSDGTHMVVCGSTSVSVDPSHTFMGPGVDVFVAKVDIATMETVWIRGFGTTPTSGDGSSDSCTSIAQDSSGNIYAAFSVYFGTAAGQTGNSWMDACVLKYDSAGTFQWVRQFGGADWDNIGEVSVSEVDGHVYGTVVFSSATTTLMGVAYTGPSTSSNCQLLFKLSPLGNVAASVQLACAFHQFASGVKVHGDNVWVASRSNRGDLMNYQGQYDVELYKYDRSLNLQWATSMGSWGGDSYGGIAEDSARGLVYVCGGTNVGISTGGFTHQGSEDVWVFAFQVSNGALQWSYQIGSSANELPSGIDILDGVLYVTGNTGNILPGATQIGLQDMFVLKLNATTGAHIWVAQLGTTAADTANHITVDSSGNAYLIGTIGSNGVILRHTPEADCLKGNYFHAALTWSQCSPCSVGTVTTQSAMTTCSACALGQGSNTANDACEICPAGTFASSGVCTVCPSGQFSSNSGSVTCSMCTPGSYSIEGATTCTSCSVGYYQNQAASSSCKVCPNLSTTATSGSSDVAQCACSDDQYGDPHESTPCRDCDPNAICDGGQYQMSKPGYWVSRTKREEIWSCVVSSSCPGGLDACESPYEGVGCKQCASGYYRVHSECRDCAAWVTPVSFGMTVLAIVLLLLISGLVCLALFLVPGYGERKKNAVVSICRITFQQIAMLQVVALMMAAGTRFTFHGEDVVMGLLRVFLLDLHVIIGPMACLGPGSMGYAPRMHVRLIVTVMAALACVTLVSLATVGVYVLEVPAALTLLRKRRSIGDNPPIDLKPKCIEDDEAGDGNGVTAQGEDMEPPEKDAALGDKTPQSMGAHVTILVGQALVVVFSEWYLCVLVSLADPFICRLTTDSDVYVVSDANVKCYAGDQEWLMAVPTGLVGLVFCGLGYPVCLVVAAVLVRKHDPREAGSNKVTSAIASVMNPVFHGHFETPFYWWEVTVALRKLACVVVLVVSPRSAYDQCTSILLVLIFALVLHNSTRPMRSPVEDLHEMFCLNCQILVAATMVLVDDSESLFSSHMETFVRVGFYAIAVFTLLLYCGSVLRAIQWEIVGDGRGPRQLWQWIRSRQQRAANADAAEQATPSHLVKVMEAAAAREQAEEVDADLSLADARNLLKKAVAEATEFREKRLMAQEEMGMVHKVTHSVSLMSRVRATKELEEWVIAAVQSRWESRHRALT